MKNSNFAAALRAVHVSNTHELLSRFADAADDVAVTYKPNPSGRIGMGGFSKTVVWAAKRDIGDDQKPMRTRREKWFAGRRASSFAKAKSWAEQHYGVGKWVACPMVEHTHVPATVVARARAAVKVKA